MPGAKPAQWLQSTLLVGLLCACTPVVKNDAFDRATLERRPLPAGALSEAPRAERVLSAGPQWFGDADPAERLIFAALRGPQESLRYCAVASCDPELDALYVLPLPDGEDPVQVLANRERREALRRRLAVSLALSGDQGLLELSLSAVLDGRRLAVPMPRPRHIYAVAANFPSHLEHDLAMRLSPEELQAIRRARARVFVKYPPLTAQGLTRPDAMQIVDPHGSFTVPATIRLPGEPGGEGPLSVPRMDYEVELGVVLGRALTWDAVREADDAEIMSAVAGYVLVSDSKARNPQVVDKVRDEERQAPPDSDPYLFGHPRLDRAAAFWDVTTCRWWSYAASWADCTSLGPFLVEAPADGSLPEIDLLTARSYAAPDRRGAKVPAGRRPDLLYLRQCAPVSRRPDHADALMWSVPDIVRSILAPQDNALHFAGRVARLEAGDVIALGTPGGVVITSKPQSVFSFLHDLLFWWSPLDWHDAFFGRDAGLYLHDGDQVFHWGSGLGYQLHEVRQVGEQAGADR